MSLDRAFDIAEKVLMLLLLITGIGIVGSCILWAVAAAL